MKPAGHPSDFETEFRGVCHPIVPPPHDGLLSEVLSARHASVMRWMTPDPILMRGPSKTGGPTRDPERSLLRPLDWYAAAAENLDDDFRPSKSLSYAAGEFYLQDAGSLLPLALLRLDTPRPLVTGGQVLDLCAAPGGKATAVAAHIDDGFLLANEPIASRVGLLRMMLAWTGQTRYATSTMDPQKLSRDFPHTFDVVLVDAPCSGQSMVGRGKQKRSAFDTHTIDFNAARQRRILAAADRMLRPGGCLVYSTCTFAHAENEAQVQWLGRELGYAVDPEDRLAKYETAEGCYRLWPMRDRCDGHFASRLRKADGSTNKVEPERSPSKRRSRRDGKDSFSLSKATAWLRETIPLNDPVLGFSNGLVTSIPRDAPVWTSQRGVTGSAIATCHHQSLRPHETSAWRHDVVAATAERWIDLDDDAAMRFAAGETVELEGDVAGLVDESASRWRVVMWQGRSLGWAKRDGKRLKNHYPKSLRQTLLHAR